MPPQIGTCRAILLQCLHPPCSNHLPWYRVGTSSHSRAAFRSVRGVDVHREVVDVHETRLSTRPVDRFHAIGAHIWRIFFRFRLKKFSQGENVGVGDRVVLTDPEFGVQGKFVSSCSPPPFFPNDFPLV